VQFLPPHDPRDSPRTTVRSNGVRAGTSPNCNRKEVNAMQKAQQKQPRPALKVKARYPS
jgi:hypothetical protein